MVLLIKQTTFDFMVDGDLVKKQYFKNHKDDLDFIIENVYILQVVQIWKVVYLLFKKYQRNIYDIDFGDVISFDIKNINLNLDFLSFYWIIRVIFLKN